MKNQLNQNIRNDEILTLRPFFSIIIATYNRAQLLKRALNSLISQTEEDWEAIIIDDGSTDNTSSVVMPYLKADIKIKYLKRSHHGEAISKNAGISAAQGRFISILDSDDEYYPVHLESRKSILMQNPLVKFLYGGVRILGNQFVPDRFNTREKINLNRCVIGGTFFVDRELIISLNGFRNICYGTDADLFDRIKETKPVMFETRLPTYIYHHDIEDSISNKMFFDKMPLKELREIHSL
jgi:glycosyltransferase involved in cell wall biosynthesis